MLLLAIKIVIVYTIVMLILGAKFSNPNKLNLGPDHLCLELAF